jgi:glycosyltransferase involved in cell wall biosynthesis
VSISQDQARELRDLGNYAGCVYNGLKMAHFPFSNDHDGYLLFVGRISYEKGVHHAIDVAQNLGLPLIIAAKIDPNTNDLDYYDRYIKPRVTGKNIETVGEVGEADRNELMKNAMAFLHPVTWREPFGLTMIEAMATGCPVVAFNLGSIPEVVANRETGFVVEAGDTEAMAKAVRKIEGIDRSACRSYVLGRFSSEAMTARYLQVYDKILQGS